MEPQFQTSFIPKKPVVSGSRDNIGSSRPVNIFSAFATVLFIIMLVISVALFAYKQVLVGQIAEADANIVSAKAAFEPETIKELIDVSSRIDAAKKLLNSHIAASRIFDLLQSLTFKKVRFSNFVYANNGNDILISMDGEAQSYNALAQQAAVFSSDPDLENPTFTDFSVADNGDITTKFTAAVNPSVISYKNEVEANNQAQ